MSAEPPPVKRIVKPRSPSTKVLPIISLSTSELLIERTGQVLPIERLPSVILSEPSSLLVGQTFGRYLERLDGAFKGHPRFQYKLVPIERPMTRLNGEERPRAILMETVCSFVGFKGDPRAGWKNHYHYPLDPVAFVRLSIAELKDDDTPLLESLLEWAQEVRQFCIAEGLEPRPSAGGLAAQLLRDKRFYPEARRKVPKMINAIARPHLPGNYYELFTDPHDRQDALYLDMSSAHHNCASEIKFPCANTLNAHGFYRTQRDLPWCYPESDRFRKAITRPGLFLVKLWVPHLPPGAFPPPYMKGPGGRLAWVYSNELPLIRALGGRIAYIVAAYLSDEAETGLNKFARWALARIAENAPLKPWLKPTLLSTYGVLACRPREFEVGFKQAKGGEEGHYPVGRSNLPVKIKRGGHEVESNIANVIHRGMIEAEVRLRCLNLARSLHAQGVRVLCIYADSLFVQASQLPLLPYPWTLKAKVTGLRFLSATQFHSAELTRLPGIPRERRLSSVRAGR